MSLTAMSIAVVLAATLLWAGARKLIDRSGVASTMTALGVPAKWAGRTSGIVPVCEIATAFGLLFAPASIWTQVGVVVLGTAFAFAGALAVLRQERIHCNCFGFGASGAHLGRWQIMALPAWVGAAAMLHYGVEQPVPIATGAALFALVGLAMVIVKAAELWQALGDARGDRLSAQEMYTWLPRR